ncbi:MAG: Rieske (2Fe-2S) protein [Verrucomicrobiota bacterium]|nr:Rieske (2Fe-2S) protein [Verrucomicrobiota bacterium]MEE2614095.1 Rieske (2Fe-2S) protein [Verrucomicrobiota bacterium]
MDNNEDINPDSSAVPEQDSVVEAISNIDSDIVQEVSDENATSPVACRLSEVETSTESEEDFGERRGFVKFLCIVIGGIVSAVPFGAGIWAYLNPLTREKEGSGDGFVKITTLDAIPADGTPTKFSVISDKEDAWNKFKNISVGAIYLRKEDGKVKALHTVCPHLGCFIDYRSIKNDFFCPCHNSNFKLDGSIVSGVSPRPMDPLKIEIRNKVEVWVKFQNFQPGHDHPIPLS